MGQLWYKHSGLNTRIVVRNHAEQYGAEEHVERHSEEATAKIHCPIRGRRKQA